MAAKFHLKKAKDGQFHFNLHAANGEIILTSVQTTSCRPVCPSVSTFPTSAGTRRSVASAPAASAR